MFKLRLALLVLLAMCIMPSRGSAQQRSTLTGQVTEASGQPLAGAVVTIPSLRLQATTDERGRFAIANVPAGTHTLRINLIGYKQTTREVRIGGDAGGTTAPLTVAMGVDPLRLDEVVAIGYGEERRANLGGSTASMKPAEIKEAPITNIQQAMQGRLPGVQINQNSGSPGAATSVRIRGSSSISGGNAPLYVVDGVPMTQGDFNFGWVGFGGQDTDALNDLNPNEIEDIQVLKDASAAAIYGSRASNGVVLIKTKRGMAGTKAEITFNAYTGTQKTWRRPEMLNAAQFTEVYNEGCMARYGSTCVYNVGQAAPTSGAPTFLRGVAGTDVNWINEVLQDAPIASFDGGIRGGTDKVRYYVNGSYIGQDGIQKSEDFRRINGRINLDYNPFSKLAVGTNVALAHNTNHRARNDNTIYGAFANAIAQMPIQPVFDSDGKYYLGNYSNPVALNNEADARDRTIRILGNAFADYAIVTGLNARFSAGVDNYTLRQNSWDSPTFIQGPWYANGGMVGVANSFVNKLTYEGTLNFNRAFANVHTLSGVVGASYEKNTSEQDATQGTNFPNEFFKYVTSAATISGGSSNHSDWGLTSTFGRLSYTYNDRITATVNARRDGSSRFGTNNQYGTFPSASIVWRVGEESFMKSQSFLANLAVRASLGITGNQQDLGNFASRGLFGGGANYNDQPGIAPSQLANPDLKWEKTKQWNLGTDFSLLNDHLGLTFDVYNKHTSDLLVQRPVPRTTGFSSIWSNVGSMENKGVEAAVVARILKAANADGFNWTTTLNLSRNRNKVLELYNHQAINAGFANRVEEGKPLAFFYGHVVEGIFQDASKICTDPTGKLCLANGLHAVQTVNSNPARATSPGDLMFKDINGRGADGKLNGLPDGIINDDDRTDIGNPWPKFEGGFTNTISFKGFDATAFLQFSQGNQIFNAMMTYTDQFGSGGDNNSIRALDRWTPTHTNTDQPRAVWGDPNRNTRNSSRMVSDGSYMRLKNLILGFKLPSSIAAKGGFRTARVYVQGQNVFTNTDYEGFDPEVNYQGESALTRGTDFYTIPQSRVWSVGMNVAF